MKCVFHFTSKGLEEGIDGYAVIGGMNGIFISLGTLEERFCGNATPVKANTAKVFFFNHTYPESQLSGSYCCHVSAGTTSDYQ